MSSLLFLQSVEDKIVEVYDEWMVAYHQALPVPMKPTRSQCHTVVNAIASYLSVHFQEKVKHYSSGVHGWGMTDDYFFDFNLVGEQAIHPRGSDRYNAYHPLSFNNDFIKIYDKPLLAMELASKYTCNSDQFITYLKENITIIDEVIVNEGYYHGLTHK